MYSIYFLVFECDLKFMFNRVTDGLPECIILIQLLFIPSFDKIIANN